MYPLPAANPYPASLEPAAQDLAAAVRAGWAGGRFALAWEAVLNVRDGACEALRARLRWTHPRLGPLAIGPEDEAVQTAGVAGTLDEWVLERSLAHLARTAPVGGAAPAVQVALGCGTVKQPYQAERLRARCQAAGVAPGRVQVVLGEPAGAVGAAAAARALGEAGFGLVLDDVARGPVCLGEWLGLPMAALAVPMAWIRAQVADGSVGWARVQTLVRVAHAWGARAAATGVDEPHDLALLRRLRLDTAQGLAVGPWAQPGLPRLPAAPAPNPFTV